MRCYPDRPPLPCALLLLDSRFHPGFAAAAVAAVFLDCAGNAVVMADLYYVININREMKHGIKI